MIFLFIISFSVCSLDIFRLNLNKIHENIHLCYCCLENVLTMAERGKNDENWHWSWFGMRLRNTLSPFSVYIWMVMSFSLVANQNPKTKNQRSKQSDAKRQKTKKKLRKSEENRLNVANQQNNNNKSLKSIGIDSRYQHCSICFAWWTLLKVQQQQQQIKLNLRIVQFEMSKNFWNVFAVGFVVE